MKKEKGHTHAHTRTLNPSTGLGWRSTTPALTALPSRSAFFSFFSSSLDSSLSPHRFLPSTTFVVSCFTCRGGESGTTPSLVLLASPFNQRTERRPRVRAPARLPLVQHLVVFPSARCPGRTAASPAVPLATQMERWRGEEATVSRVSSEQMRCKRVAEVGGACTLTSAGKANERQHRVLELEVGKQKHTKRRAETRVVAPPPCVSFIPASSLTR